MILRKQDSEELVVNIKKIVPTVEELEYLQNKLKNHENLTFTDCLLIDKIRIWNILLNSNNIKF